VGQDGRRLSAELRCCINNQQIEIKSITAVNKQNIHKIELSDPANVTATPPTSTPTTTTPTTPTTTRARVRETSHANKQSKATHRPA
jgi:hypothetical protein